MKHASVTERVILAVGCVTILVAAVYMALALFLILWAMIMNDPVASSNAENPVYFRECRVRISEKSPFSWITIVGRAESDSLCDGTK